MKTVTILPPKAVLMVAKKDFKMIIIQISIDLLKANNLGAWDPPCKSFRLEDGKRSRTLSFAPALMSKMTHFNKDSGWA